MTKARDTANIVGGGFSGTIAGATMEPTGDTAAGDNAAIGFTSGEGLILTGQGSTGDVTIKNDADALVAHVPTGTTGVTFAGTPTFPDGSIAVADLDIDGGTDIGAALVDADLMIVDDGAGGTNRKATMARLATYMNTKVSGGGAMEFIASTGAMDDAATVVFTSSHFDSSKYRNYVFIASNVIPVTDAQTIRMVVSTDNGSSYLTGNIYQNSNSSAIAYAKVVHWAVGSAANESGWSGEVRMYNPHDTGVYTQVKSDTFGEWFNGGMYSSYASASNTAIQIKQTASINNIKLIFSSGNFESGYIDMYGIKKA